MTGSLSAPRPLRAVVLLATGLVACGHESTAIDSDDIVGGSAERRFEGVGYLAIEDRTTGHFAAFCTGTLVAPRVVVTAAHCTYGMKRRVQLGSSAMSFSTGTTTSTSRKPATVVAIYENPSFDPSASDYFTARGWAHDIALVILAESMTAVTPVAMAPADDTREHLAVGYGRTEPGPLDHVEDGPQPRKSLRLGIREGSPESYYVTDPIDGAVCYGDSGGPLLEVTSKPGAPTRVALVGVLAAMNTVDPQNVCVPGTEAYYSSVTAQKGWIDEVIALASRAPSVPTATLPEPSSLPLAPADVLRIGSASDVEMMSAWTVNADGSVDLFFDRGDEASTTSKLYGVHSPDGRHFALPEPLALGELGDAGFVAGPSVVGRGPLDAFLYFVSAPGLRSPATVARAKIIDGRVATAEALPPIAGIASPLSWPGFFEMKDTTMVVAFRDGRSIPAIALSVDGKQFGQATAVSTTGGAMATAAELEDQTLLYTFQTTTQTESMVSVAMLLRPGAPTWSKPIRITGASSNVHDTSILPCAGGGADLYYIYPPDDHGFSLFRRHIGADGALGVEQRLTTSAVGEPSKPRATRLPNGKVLVAWADIAKRSATFQPAVQQIVIAELPGDAP